MELITAGITCFNARDTIERAVQSAQAQTWQHLEIVVVDDCSTDDTWSIVQRLAAEDDRLRAFRHPDNRGVATARNTVLGRAAGEFVAFFDDDDVSRLRRVDEQYRRIVDYERTVGTGAVVSYSATERVFPDGKKRYSPTLGMDVTPAPAGEAVARLILTGEPVRSDTGTCPTSSQMARRAVYERSGGFDESLRRHEDTDFNLRLALQGAHFAGLSDPLVVQTVTFAGDKTLDEERRYALQLIDKHRELLERWNWYEFCRRWAEMKYATLEGGAMTALPHLARLLIASPLKLARKAAWSLPNRENYRRYGYPHE